MKRNETGKLNKLRIFLMVFAGFLMSFLVTMIYIGGDLNFKEFTSAGRVYDFSQKEICKTVSRWRYSEEAEGFWIRKDNALKKYLLDGGEHRWRYLYITVRELSMSPIPANIVYYSKENKKITEQSISLEQGENIIILNEEIPMYRMGIRLLDGDGQFIAIQSMQLRWNPSGMAPGRFEKIFLISYGAFLVILGGYFLLRRKGIIKIPEKGQGYFKQWIDLLRYAYHLCIDRAGKINYDKFQKKERSFFRRLSFSLIFLWMIFANVSGWIVNNERYRYHILICSVMILLISVFTWEKPVKGQNWTTVICKAWLILAAGMVISDLFVDTRAKFAGIALLLPCGILIAAWRSMEQPKELVYEILQALEIDFGIAVIYCMIFRTKKLTIQYNGIFRSSDEFSMYAVLMLSVFMMEIYWLINKEKRNFRKFTFYMAGAAVSFYFVIRAAVGTGIAAVLCIFLILAVRECRMYRKWVVKMQKIGSTVVLAAGIAFLCVCAVHFSTKCLPDFLHTAIEYNNERLVTNVSPEEMKAFEELQPGLMKGAVSRESMEIPVIQKNYIRKLGLIGRGEKVKVFRKAVPAYSAYLQQAYRYGIFILLPYVILQIGMAAKGFTECRRRKAEGDVSLWIFMVSAIFICFSIGGNAETAFGHPLWFCFYILGGFWFEDTAALKAPMTDTQYS